MVVHFPIALIITAVILEFFQKLSGKKLYSQGISALIYLGTISAIGAAIFGYILMSTEDYSGNLVDRHFYLGISTAVICIIISWIRYQKLSPNIYFSSLITGVALITITGHMGAELTHGEGYLTEVFEVQESNEEMAVFLKEIGNSSQGLSDLQMEKLSMSTKAIFAHNCYQCHNENKEKGGLVLDSKEGVFAGGESGPVIVEGNPDASEMFRRISLPSNHDDVMPKKGKKLPPEEIKIIKTWIEQGAYYNEKNVKIFPEAEMSLSKPAIPKNDKYSNAIDKIVAAYFSEKSIDFPEVVDDRLFIRRIYLDVIGTLPTSEEVKQFTSDNSPDKREKLIKNLLNRNEDYTRHWLTFWNDLLRNDYSGTGFITGGRKQITQWLHESLYNNEPYDTMVTELLNPTPQSEGFIKGIKWRGAVNSSQTTEMQAAQNIGQSLLGVNVKCASCHNSFVSNLTLEQTYGFANIFTDSTLEIERCDKPTGKMAKTGFLYPELGEVKGENVSDRLESLADVVVNPDNGRLYRTFVNRIWGKFTGRGIIANYDEMDNKPWEQTLLDFLAAEFREDSTDIKNLIYLITSSKTYQLPSVSFEKREEIYSDKYEFRGPLKKRLSAEQFADAISQVVYPLYANLGYDPYNFNNPANWIWKSEIEFDRAVLPKPGVVYFRYNFTSEEETEGEFMITADDRYTFYVNGEKVSEDDDWQTVEKGKIQLRSGENVLGLKAENMGSVPKPAGVMMALKYKLPNGTDSLISTNGKWKYSEEPEDGWNNTGFSASDWAQAQNQRRVWGIMPAFTFDNTVQMSYIRASLVKLDPFLKALGRPSRDIVITNRDNQATLLQALELTNGEFLYAVLDKGAAKLEADYTDNETLVKALYQQLLARKPNEEELELLAESISQKTRKDDIRDVLWTTFMLPEFQFIN